MRVHKQILLVLVILSIVVTSCVGKSTAGIFSSNPYKNLSPGRYIKIDNRAFVSAPDGVNANGNISCTEYVHDTFGNGWSSWSWSEAEIQDMTVSASFTSGVSINYICVDSIQPQRIINTVELNNAVSIPKFLSLYKVAKFPTYQSGYRYTTLACPDSERLICRGEFIVRGVEYGEMRIWDLKIDTSGLPPGVYLLMNEINNGFTPSVATAAFVIIR